MTSDFNLYVEALRRISKMYEKKIMQHKIERIDNNKQK